MTWATWERLPKTKGEEETIVGNIFHKNIKGKREEERFIHLTHIIRLIVEKQQV